MAKWFINSKIQKFNKDTKCALAVNQDVIEREIINSLNKIQITKEIYAQYIEAAKRKCKQKLNNL